MKILYFNTGGGENAAGESAAYPVSSLRGFYCRDATSISIYFLRIVNCCSSNSESDVRDVVTLTITSGKHQEVIRDITNLINDSKQSFIMLANQDDSVYAVSNVTACAITYGQ